MPEGVDTTSPFLYLWGVAGRDRGLLGVEQGRPPPAPGSTLEAPLPRLTEVELLLTSSPALSTVERMIKRHCLPIRAKNKGSRRFYNHIEPPGMDGLVSIVSCSRLSLMII